MVPHRGLFFHPLAERTLDHVLEYYPGLYSGGPGAGGGTCLAVPACRWRGGEYPVLGGGDGDSGCLFVIPTAAEIPIVQTMMLAGMGFAPALALLITLPAVSVPSLIMLRKAFPAKALWLTGGLVALCGAVVGGLALL